MKETLTPQVRFGVFELDVRRAELRNGNGAIPLQEQPFQILLMLVEHDGQIVTREEIQKRLWPDDTVVEFDQSINAAMKKLRKALGDSADEPTYIRTIAKQGYRLIVPVERIAGHDGSNKPAETTEASVSTRDSIAEEQAAPTQSKVWVRLAAAAVVVIATILVGVLYWRAHRPPKLTDADTIVIADFENKTGDPIFDDTLKQALAIQLQQSPFLNILSNRRFRETLKLMNHPATGPLTGDVVREVCLRSGSKAMVVGSIVTLGGEYVIELRTVDCNLGDSLGEVQERAKNKEGVLSALDRVGTKMRSKLGESLGSVERYSTPLSQATTPSLEALKAFSTAIKVERAEGWTAAIPSYRRAVELDPNFATAWNDLAISYHNLNQGERAQEYSARAYQLRDRVSERERFAIEAHYYQYVTGELNKAAQTYELWHRSYPREVAPFGNLGVTYAYLGELESYLKVFHEAMRLDPNYGVVYGNLAGAYMNMNRLDDAEQVFKQAEQRNVSAESLLRDWYLLAFVKGDTPRMQQMVSAAMGKPGREDLLLASQADTEGWYGRLHDAQMSTQRAMHSAQANDAKETAGNYAVAAALREVAVGQRGRARADALAALKLSQSREVNAMSAVALAQAGDASAAEKLASELDKDYPLSTMVQSYWLPTIHASRALQENDPRRAIELLNNMGPMELGVINTGVNVFMCPVYVRGQAYLALHDGSAAAAEFQKFLDHYGLITNFPWGALARLGLARAYALEAQTDPAYRDKARTAYQNFLTLWKDADPDIPIYKQAKAESAKLQQPATSGQ